MSEFASMLASFKQNAAASSSSSNQQPPSRNNPSSGKRPHPSSNIIRAQPHYFPSMHYYNSQNKGEGGLLFELSFLVIGAQKAGTSWLHALLQKCNALSLPTEQKEVHFWDWHYKRGIDWYIRQFDFPPKKKQITKMGAHDTTNDGGGNSSFNTNTNNNTNNNNPLYGEITPCYIVLNPAAIAEIHKCFPNLKIIFVARDPVDRAWSAMIMELRDRTSGLTAGEFAQGSGVSDGKNNERGKRAKKGGGGEASATKISVAQRRRMQRQSDPSSRTDSYYIERLRSETHSSRSDYATHLSNWYSHYPSENVLIVDYRDIETDPRDALLKIVMHVGVEEKEARSYVENLSDGDVRQRVNAATNAMSANNGGKNPANMQKSAPLTSQHSLSERPRLRRQMEAYLRPFATKFNSLLEEKGYSWNVNEYTT